MIAALKLRALPKISPQALESWPFSRSRLLREMESCSLGGEEIVVSRLHRRRNKKRKSNVIRIIGMKMLTIRIGLEIRWVDGTA